ncbi:single-stranded-DNA-specific exonuclease RecJ [Candidatus Sneabacter namystus]|uniref:Single-stranded-DNA-specific exonuclease RecJ n=1 Tax=Candidatus Sneabacter namystus TaxID=2601646 RepID=A0A5C0UK78_9RICK|nr:single-stranded-DNA-specific exonuclease RecJ [Candidatus Sneabacter namystus]QEK39842.1 single-stranded-DNA-specific exonuclease RecJ [Candidatus Sneabacter namystus]
MFSILKKRWLLKQHKKEIVEDIKLRYKLNDIVAQVISSRIEISDVNFFLFPTLRHQMPNPFVLKDMDCAVECVKKTLLAKERICIFADYDVDGATSCAVLKKFFKALGVECNVYIPDRITEGYGLSESAIKRISQHSTCIISVDCGSVSFEEIMLAKSLGMSMVVLDHHICTSRVADADAVVNPNRLDDTSGLHYMAAVGVTYMFIVALSSCLKDTYLKRLIETFDLLSLLDLVALGTVCDVMPLIKLNRVFVTQGLKILKKRQNVGLRNLSDTAALAEEPTVRHLGFVFGPMINAGGRVGDSMLGAKLLSTDSEAEAVKISTYLHECNVKRRKIQDDVMEEACQLIVEHGLDNVIVVCGDLWHVGVIGIVASRLKEIYDRPVAVISLDENGIGRASWRSIKGFNFGAAILLAKEKNLITEGGGHDMAAGFSVTKDKVEDLRLFLSNEFNKSSIQHHCFFDFELPISAFTSELFEQLSFLEPFGVGNATPVFKMTQISVINAKVVNNKHVSCILVDIFSKKSIPAIAFEAISNGIGKVLLTKNVVLSVIVTLRRSYWKHKETITCEIKDIIY